MKIGRPKKVHDPRRVKVTLEGFEADSAAAAHIPVAIALRTGLKVHLPEQPPRKVYEILIEGESKAIADHRKAIAAHEREIEVHAAHLEEYQAKLKRVGG